MTTFLAVGLALTSWSGVAQTKPATLPDAQVEANVLKALAGAPELADQSITSTTVYGTVTLNGTVRDEPSRDMAEHLIANTAGVQKVVDELVIGTPANAVTNDSQSGASNPNLQSDGTVAPAQDQTPANQGNPRTSEVPSNGVPAQQGQYPRQQGQQQPYGRQQPYVAQKGGDVVIVPSGSILRVRINQGMNSKMTAPGTTFDGVVLSDVFAGGFVAIPRGAAIQGTVVDAHTAGQLNGKGELKLQLTSVTFGGRTYPITTDFWWHQGADKTANTVGNTVGLASVGALIGAVAGGGVGAAVGAGVGGVAGLGVSSASRRGEASMPAEAIISFHLTQFADVTTVSQAELNRLGAGVPYPQMQRRYPPPPPPPPYPYGPGYYYPR
ncbi:MAG: BON domain-containing protein [Edaphobacter sp.]